MFEKTILITGATSGIGLETANYLYESGYKLFLTGRDEEKLKEVSKHTGNSPYYVLDLEKTEQIEGIAEFFKENNIKLDGMVHSAGCVINAYLRSFSFEQAEKHMRIHYYAFIELCKNIYSKRILNNNGSIVAVSSIASLIQDKTTTLYAASKSALNSAVTIGAQEFAKKQIRVNAVLPAMVETRMTEKIIKRINISDFQPFGAIPPREIAYAIEFLLSEKSRYITGALIPITGGIKY